ncbi:MAG: hypothetical protein HY286_12550 [Planctomycetes bacterium]|nr:hypothetical protein [Planctomycetota bacterium]
MKHRPLAACIVISSIAGCRTPVGSYLEDRVNDTLDVVPITVSFGPGLFAGVQATPFFGTGFGVAKEWLRFGWLKTKSYNAETRLDLQRMFLASSGFTGGTLLAWAHVVEVANAAADGGTTSALNAGNSLLFIPMIPFHLGDHPYFDAVSSLNIEVDLHVAIIGVHVGISPVNAVDWLLGWFSIDFAGDDMNLRFPREAKIIEKAIDKESPAPRGNE